MSLTEAYEWLDMLAEMAFSSAEPFEDRAAYGTWWADLAYGMKEADVV